MSSAAGATRSELDRVFAPRSVAIVGASSDPAKRGFQILRGLSDSGFGGSVYPVNPRGGTILERTVCRSLEEIPETPDLAVLCTPAPLAPDLVRACGKRGVAGAIVLAVGFGESGPEGKALEDELARAGREVCVRIVGPNTSGMLRTSAGLNLVGAQGVRAGGVALVAQSGNVGLALMTEVTERSWEGLSLYLGIGNELDIGFSEALEFLEADSETRSIIVYAEAFADPRRFLATAARVTRQKPVVAIVSGRTQAGAAAAASHTGSIAGPYERLKAALGQAGVVEVARTDELLAVAETLGNQPAVAPGLGIVILSDGGGQGALAADALVEAGGTLASLAPGTQRQLRDLLGGAAAVANPVDLAGAADADPLMFARATDLILSDAGTGAILVVGLFGGYAVRFSEHLAGAEVEAAREMHQCAQAHRTALVVHSMYAHHRTAALAELGTARVPVLGSLETACRAIIELQRRGQQLAKSLWNLSRGAAPRRATEPVAEETLTEPAARALLRESGLHLEIGAIVRSAGEAADFVDAHPGSHALKLVSETITHKSDAGGVVLDVSTPAAAAEAFDTIMVSAAAYSKEHGLPQTAPRVLITPMLPPPRLELLIGAVRDPQLGPVLTVGAGGIWVEALRDASHRVLPVRDDEVEEMLKDLRVGVLLAEGRGHPPVYTDPIVQVARAVADCMVRNEWVTEVEINPLFVYSDHCSPVDARVVRTVE